MSTFLTYAGILLFSVMFGLAGQHLFGWRGVVWAVLIGAGIVMYVNGKLLP